jgi:hypothetical protein
VHRTNIFKYLVIDKGDNKIGDAGVGHLCKAQWKTLTLLYIGTFLMSEGYNEIREEGVLRLVRANWNNLDNLNICINLITYHPTNSRSN